MLHKERQDSVKAGEVTWPWYTKMVYTMYIQHSTLATHSRVYVIYIKKTYYSMLGKYNLNQLYLQQFP